MRLWIKYLFKYIYDENVIMLLVLLLFILSHYARALYHGIIVLNMDNVT